MAIKQVFVALATIGMAAHVGHTHPVGGVAMRTNNVQRLD
jgi:hypothetical protein